MILRLVSNPGTIPENILSEFRYVPFVHIFELKLKSISIPLLSNVFVTKFI